MESPLRFRNCSQLGQITDSHGRKNWVRSSRSLARASPSTRRILADDIHRFILSGNLGQALRAPMVPTWPSSRAFGDPPAEGFRSRPRLTRVVANVFNLGAARATPQDDFGAVADQYHQESLPRIPRYGITGQALGLTWSPHSPTCGRVGLRPVKFGRDHQNPEDTQVSIHRSSCGPYSISPDAL
jgi:hypothetical protein